MLTFGAALFLALPIICAMALSLHRRRMAFAPVRRPAPIAESFARGARR